VPFERASCSVLTHGLNYGTSVFEGIRAYETRLDEKSIFRNRDHMERFIRSAKMLRMNMRYDTSELEEAVKQVVLANRESGDFYIRPIAYVGFGGISLDYTNYPVDVAIGALSFSSYFDPSKKGLRACISSWRRVSQDSGLPLAKAGGNYLNSSLAKVEASTNGYDEAIFLDQQGYVSEGTGENVFAVYRGEILTPPVHQSILEGITRDTVSAIATRMGYRVREKPVTRGELYRCDELFFSGTAAGVAPVVELDGRVIGTGEEGSVTRSLREEYEAVVRGKRSYAENWLTRVSYPK
jgi:branched-chain amino acid aminotransferase